MRGRRLLVVLEHGDRDDPQVVPGAAIPRIAAPYHLPAAAMGRLLSDRLAVRELLLGVASWFSWHLHL